MRTLILLLAGATAWAEDRWTRLESLEPSLRTTVQTMDGKRHRGGFVLADSREIVVRLKDRDQAFAKDDVMEVRAGGGRRSTGSLKAAILGGGLPLAIGLAAGGPVVGLRYAAAIGGYGAAASAIGSRGERVIYRARRK